MRGRQKTGRLLAARYYTEYDELEPYHAEEVKG